MIQRENQKISKIFWKKEILDMKKAIETVEVSESIYEYICNIVFATRNTQKYSELTYWASPRASLALLRTAKAQAFIEGRDYVIPEDIKALAYWVLRHRIILSYEAMAEDISSDEIITRILQDIIIR
jgi:MoxR-like ATPase